MKHATLRIGCDWLERSMGSAIERACYAELSISVGDSYITRLEDLAARTIRTRMRCSAYDLAMWFAANWWRLRWEPGLTEIQDETDWLMAHSIGAAGGGYAWPIAIFSSDGRVIEIASWPSRNTNDFHPVRYLDRIRKRIPASDFESAITEFNEQVIARLDALSIVDTPLHVLWREVQGERADHAAERMRKLEALAGYDPDAAPDDFLQAILISEAELGMGAIEELLAAYQHKAVGALAAVKRLMPGGVNRVPGSFLAAIDQLQFPNANFEAGEPTWLTAHRLAFETRAVFGLGQEPIDNARLSKIIGTNAGIFNSSEISPEKMTLAVKEDESNTRRIYISSRHNSGRRFAACRILGDIIAFTHEEKLSPVTESKTMRQKFQRSFAQEFLCPVAVIRNAYNASFHDDDYLELADKYGVSELFIKTTLVNENLISRNALDKGNWID